MLFQMINISDFKHKYLRSRALSLSSPFSFPVTVSQIWPLSRYSCFYLGSLHPRNFRNIMGYFKNADCYSAWKWKWFNDFWLLSSIFSKNSMMTHESLGNQKRLGVGIHPLHHPFEHLASFWRQRKPTKKTFMWLVFEWYAFRGI